MTSDLSVLLVDDDPHACNIFKMVMEHHQLDFQIVNDAESGLQHLETAIPDVVVMDIFLPGIDGYQALSKIRQAGLVPQTRFVATTAYYTNDTPQEVIEHGFDGFIPKPFQTMGLVDYLKDIVNKE